MSCWPQQAEQVADVILELIRSGAERADLVPERFRHVELIAAGYEAATQASPRMRRGP